LKNAEITFQWLQEKTKQIQLKQAQQIPEVFQTVPKRLWLYFLEKSGIDAQLQWSHVSKQHLQKLSQHLFADTYEVKGKSTFKEEFVTAGGVSLKSIDMKTMQSKSCKGLYFAGELTDVDGFTGGFNFQAAWSTGYTVAHSIFE